MSDLPIEPEYNPVEEAQHQLARELADRLEDVVHPIAEHFVAQFTERAVTEQLSPVVLKFSGCVSEAAARRLFGTLMVGITQEYYLALMTAFQLGWLAHEQAASGKLHLPEG
jgi:hypothetical protein